jgi:TATA-binding protein-associated factor
MIVDVGDVLQPLTDMSIDGKLQEEALQQPAAEALAEVIVQCVGRKPSPNEKLIKNLCALTCADPVETPKATEANAATVNIEDIEATPVGKVGKNMKLQLLSASEERSRLEGAITRRGAEFSLKSLCEKFGDTLLEQLLKLWECLTEALGQPSAVAIPGSLPELTADPQALITNLQVVRSVAPVVDKKLHPKMLSLLPAIFSCVRHEHAAVRLVASRCITSMARVMTEPVMAEVLKLGVPMLGDITSVEARQGAGMLVTSLVDGLGPELIAYAPLLIVPLLGCMSDSNLLVRQSVTNSFAALVPLLPLARGVPAPGGLDECQASKSAEDTRFLDQLLDNSQVEDYKLTVPIKATLRRYQQEGINWLAFLKRFKLHGILCDDMGLGKTLQASAILASDTAERLKNTEVAPLPSLVVCPPTLVGHWAFEIEKFIPSDILNPLQYAGSVPERASLRTKFQNHNVIVTSYDVLRKDVDILAQQVWNYCILDEGHIIKSAKSKITQAAKRIQADHRLILTGTPIQNNVLELWSLFDFLMPGFLGTERQVLHSNLFGILSSELFVGNRQLDCTFLCRRSQWKIGPSP